MAFPSAKTARRSGYRAATSRKARALDGIRRAADAIIRGFSSLRRFYITAR